MNRPTPIGASENQSSQATPKLSIAKIIVWAIYLISFGLLAWFFIEGFSYYTTPFVDRPHHPDYRNLRPAGSTGLLYGYAGAFMMIVMLAYSMRKRTPLLGKATTLQSMLNFHIYLGIVGPLLIVLHTSFKIQGLVAISFWSMVAVALSGFFGRYLYKQIPRNVQGAELTLKELGRLSAERAAELQSKFHLNAESIARLEAVINKFATHLSGSAMKSVMMLLTDDLFRFWSRHRFSQTVKHAVSLSSRELHDFTREAFSRALLQRRITLLNQVQRIFHYWHVVHKPFAIIMYLIMVVHIGIAIWTGYGWPW